MRLHHRFMRLLWPWSRQRSSTVTFDSAPVPIDQLWLEMRRSTGTTATRSEALSVPAIRRGRNEICGSIASMPLELVGPDHTVRPSPLLGDIDLDVANVVTISQTLEDLIFEGIAWWMVTAVDLDGFPIAARHVDVANVSLQPPAGVKVPNPSPLPSGEDPRGAVVWVDGVAVSGSRIIRFDSPNPALLHHAGREIRRAILLDQAAGVYADDPRPLDYFTPSDGAEPVSDDDIEQILAQNKARRKARSTMWVPNAMAYHTVDAPSPQQMQLAELSKQASLDIANSLGVDPEDLGISTTSRTYSNDVDRRRNKLNEVLAPYMRAITDRLSKGDVTRTGDTVRFNTTEYLLPNPTERWQTYQTAHSMEAITVDEIRDAEGLPPLPADVDEAEPAAAAGVQSRQLALVEQIQKIYLGVGTVITAAEAREILNRSGAGLEVDAPVTGPAESAAPEEPAPEVDEADEPAEVDAGRPAAHTFDEPQNFTLSLPVVEFSVDRENRIIEGLAVPWRVVGSKGGIRFRFDRGSLQWSADAPGRVKLLFPRHTMAVGRAIQLRDTPRGLMTRFKVGRGADGDRALESADDGVFDGFSIGVDFDLQADTVPDPRNKGALLVRRADLRHVALTDEPVFDDARVSHVAASRESGGGPVPETENTEPEAPETPEPQPTGLTLSDDQLTALLSRPGAIQALVAAQQPPAEPETPAGALTLSADQVDGLIRSGALIQLLGLPGGPAAPAAEPERPAVVDPTRPTGFSRVTEPTPYRFDREGNLREGTHDFSSDLIAAGRDHDQGAYDRALAFVQAQFDTDVADAAAINPNINRPDLYVDQLDFVYPLWQSINRGTIANVTPFVVPKFNTSSGLVGDHTEAVEPTAGTFTVTSQTITPTALSGKVEITREAWDQGGNPQLSGLIWQQMTREWNEELESATATFLNTLTAAVDINLGVAVFDDALQSAWNAAMASLQFVRGGHRFSMFGVHIDLYKAFVDAVDTNGRPLFPILQPQNASGTASPRFGLLDLGGVTGVPSWALGATGTVAANSWLFNPEDVHGWASMPQRLQFESRVSHVDVGIWGYKAFANTRIDGVRQVIFDPA